MPTIPLTPVPETDMAFDAARRAYDFEVARAAHDEELARGGAIKRQGYESSGVGATIGSTVGAVAGGLATKNPAGASVGAGAGAMVGEAVEQGVHALTSPTPGSITPGESAAGFGEQALFAGGGELAATAFRTLRPVQYVTPRALTPEQVQRKAVFDQYHIPYLPHEITDSGFHKLLADLGESGVLNPNAYAELRRDQNALRKLAINGIADQVGANVPPNQLAQNVVKVVRDAREAMSDGIDVLYNTIREDLKYDKQVQMVPTGRMIPNKSGLVGPGTQVPEMVKQESITGGRWADISKTKEVFDKAKESYEDASRHLNQPDMLQAPWYQTITKASALPDQAQWNDAHVFLKETRAEMRRVQDAKAAGSDTATMADLGALKKIETTLEIDLQKSLENSPDPTHQRALATWTTAQKEVKAMSEAYRNDTILSFVRKVDQHGGEPAMKEFVVSMSPEDTQKVLTATKTDPVLQASLKRSFIQTGLERAGGQPGDELVFDPKKARNFLFGKDEFTARKTDMLVPQRTQDDLANFLNATQQQIDTSKQGKTGVVFMAMKSSGMLFTVPATVLGATGLYAGKEGSIMEAGGELAGSATFLMTPGWIAKALQNHTTANLLIQGLRSSYSQTAVGRVTQQLARLDETFARSIQTGLNMSGVKPFTPAPTTSGQLTQPSTAFPLEK